MDWKASKYYIKRCSEKIWNCFWSFQIKISFISLVLVRFFMYNLELYLVLDPRFNFQKVNLIKTHLDDTITGNRFICVSVKTVQMTRKKRTVQRPQCKLFTNSLGLWFISFEVWGLKVLNLNSSQLKNGLGTESSISWRTYKIN